MSKEQEAEHPHKEIIDNYVDENYPDEYIVRLDGFDESVVGIVTGGGSTAPRLVYDYDALVESMINDEVSYDGAVDFFYYNIMGSTVGGHGSPVFLERIPELDALRKRVTPTGGVVDVALLEEQRAALTRVISCSITGAQATRGDIDLVEGIQNMLDHWSDTVAGDE